MVSRILAAGLMLGSLWTGRCWADTPAAPTPLKVVLPSAEPSGNPTNDWIRLIYYPAVGAQATRSPAVILIHPLGESRNRNMHQLARYLARQGMAGAVITLPYHM